MFTKNVGMWCWCDHLICLDLLKDNNYLYHGLNFKVTIVGKVVKKLLKGIKMPCIMNAQFEGESELNIPFFLSHALVSQCIYLVQLLLYVEFTFNNLMWGNNTLNLSCFQIWIHLSKVKVAICWQWRCYHIGLI